MSVGSEDQEKTEKQLALAEEDKEEKKKAQMVKMD